MQTKQILIVGGGLAGLSAALKLAKDGFDVCILSKKPVETSSTWHAQGGIAAVTESDDSFESHIEDTLIAGAGLCTLSAVRQVVENGPAAIEWLLNNGTEFSTVKNSDNYHLTKEGGHAMRRIYHATDSTGRAIHSAIKAQCLKHPNIELFESFIAVDLITSKKLGVPGTNRCLGLYALNTKTEQVETFTAARVILATGGASKTYLYTSNPDTSTGDGIAMAYRAGSSVRNMEFNQFHPTCLFHPTERTFLISEAVRGEGGKLLLPNGESFMHRHDPRGELAPRDVVARAIDYEMKKNGFDYVHLDISHQSPEFIKSHFPTIYGRCMDIGYDMTKEPLPVVPAAHYTCGGVGTDLHARTDLAHLYAIGECTSTGLHGANRLASNSLLECIVFAQAAAANILKNKDSVELESLDIPAWDESLVSDPDEQVVVAHNWDELRRFMWDYVGIVRTDKRLARALNRIELLKHEVEDYYANFKVNSDLIELRNLLLTAELIVKSAQMRKESRGLHYTLDYPESNKGAAKDTVLYPPH